MVTIEPEAVHVRPTYPQQGVPGHMGLRCVSDGDPATCASCESSFSNTGGCNCRRDIEIGAEFLIGSPRVNAQVVKTWRSE